MIVQEKYASTLRVFAKKRKKSTSSTGSQIFNKNSARLSHYDLRLQSFQNQFGKARRPVAVGFSPKQQQKNRVEVSDDVIVVDRHGRRIPPPGYAVLRIDQLPQFKKD